MATEMAESRDWKGAAGPFGEPGSREHQRFPKHNRLLRRHEFLRLSREGRRVHTKLFMAAYAPGRTLRTRIGITVTRKVGSAAKRNRIKRQVREFFRIHRKRFPDGLDINVVAKKESVHADGEALRASLNALFARLRGGESSKR